MHYGVALKRRQAITYTKANESPVTGGIFRHSKEGTSSYLIKEPASRLFTQPFIQAQIKENITAPRPWSLCGKFTGDQWIPRTKGQ